MGVRVSGPRPAHGCGWPLRLPRAGGLHGAARSVDSVLAVRLPAWPGRDLAARAPARELRARPGRLQGGRLRQEGHGCQSVPGHLVRPGVDGEKEKGPPGLRGCTPRASGRKRLGFQRSPSPWEPPRPLPLLGFQLRLRSPCGVTVSELLWLSVLLSLTSCAGEASVGKCWVLGTRCWGAGYWILVLYTGCSAPGVGC